MTPIMAPQVSDPRRDLGIGEPRIDFLVELLSLRKSISKPPMPISIFY
jgi:hypothetical protein